jgi:uncharacterized protein
MTDAPVTLKYPLEYVFKAIGRAEDDFVDGVRGHVERAAGPVAPDRVSSRPSAHGKYVSVSVTVVLRSEEERRAVYEALHGDRRILYYL